MTTGGQGRQRGGVETSWCVLRTSGGKTIRLARALTAAGLDAWTPIERQKRRKPRSKATYEIELPILPTFVFVRAVHLDELVGAVRSPASPYPAFSLFRVNNRTPLLADTDIDAFRAEESRVTPKARKRVFVAGERVRVPNDAFKGLTGVVETSNGTSTLVGFGGSLSVRIRTWKVIADSVSTAYSDVETAA